MDWDDVMQLASGAANPAPRRVEKTEEEVLFQVAQHFYQTAQNQALLTGLQANLDKLDALSRMAEIQLKNDLAIPFRMVEYYLGFHRILNEHVVQILGFGRY